LQEGTWVKPTNIADPKIADKSVGELFNTISNGIRNMPGYARQVPPADRWAIILYVRALQKSQAEFVASATEPTK
jgi:mono/diheme cytochrome c family protein